MCIKKFLLFVSVVVISSNLGAQTDSLNAANDKQKKFSNSVKLSAGDYYTRKVARAQSFLNIHQIGISYERKLFKELFAGLSYMQWQQVGSPFVQFKTAAFEEELPLNDTLIGKLSARLHYKMVDGYAFYKKTIRNNQFINIGAGASYTWGIDSYLSWYWVNPAPLPDASYAYERRKMSYWGIMPQISYDYLFCNNRIVAGGNIRGRYYFGKPKAQYDFGIHIGVNF